MTDFYVSIAFAVLFQLLQDTRRIRQFAPAFRKAYMILHANRLLFLKPGDSESMGDFVNTEK